MLIKDVPGYTGYGASEDGKMWSKKKIGGQGSLTNTWREVASYVDPHGYYQINIKSDTKHTERRIHRIIALTFLGPITEGLEVNHINGIKTDNRVCNLELVSHQRNLQHALETKLRIPAHGEKHHWAKISNEHVEKIRELYKKGSKQKEIADFLGVNQSCISRIINNKRRKVSV